MLILFLPVAKKQSKRSRFFAFILYPYEDENHVLLLRHLISDERRIPCRIMYIHHKGMIKSTSTKKPHTHVLIAFDNPRSESSVQKMLGVIGTVWRLYTMRLTGYKDDLHRNGHDVRRERNEVWEKVPVLRDPEDPYSYIEYPYDDREDVSCVCKRHPIEDDQCFFRTPLYVVKHVEAVDFQSYAIYMLHQTYQCLLDGKERYEKSDLKGDSDLIFRAFPDTDVLGDGGMLERLYGLCGMYQPREVVRILMDNGDKDSLGFLMGHSTFVRDWFLPNQKNR